MTPEDRRRVFSEAGKLGAAVLHLGTTLDQRRERTAAARAARAAKRGPAKPTMAQRIAEAEALLPTLPPEERERQTAWVEQAKAALAELEEHRKKKVLAEAS